MVPELSPFMGLTSTFTLVSGMRMRSTVGASCSIHQGVCTRVNGFETKNMALVPCTGLRAWRGTEEAGNTTSHMVSGSMCGMRALLVHGTPELRCCDATGM